ncbi:MAG TPA: response regulator [Sphingobium sp.]|nr:response regulator [Sphingobium sp.]
MTDHPLRNLSILVVEDEYFLAAELEEELWDACAIVVGPTPSVEQALELIEQTPSLDGAILDVNLGGEAVFPVADRLAAKCIPFVFVTGYRERDALGLYADAPRVEKPFLRNAAADALGEIIGQK